MDPKKLAAEWFRSTVFRNEAIHPKPPREVERVPSAIRAARALEKGGLYGWQSREKIFLNQGKLLANYEDDYDGDCGDVVSYYPTYQSLTNKQLRGYFSWRTKLRRGEVRETSLSFAFLYIYELINQIGVADPMDGYRKLERFRDTYGQIDNRILFYLERWFTEYVVYYNLDASLLPDTSQGAKDQCVAALEHIHERNDAEIADVLRQLSGWLKRSKFYRSYQEDMDRVMVRVLRKISAHCAKNKRTMVDQYFGGFSDDYAPLFGNAVFCDPLKRKNYTYSLNEQCTYLCKDRTWTVRRRVPSPSSRGKLEDLLKTIDSAMRTAYEYGHPIKAKVGTKWILRTIQEEVQMLLAERRADEEKKITIDYGQLSKIRRDASVTQEKLIVEEDIDPVEELLPQAEEEPVPAGEGPVEEPPTAGEVPLSQEESRLLHCLLYGGGLDWVQREGLLLSVLVDGINEKLYDTFADCVLDDTPQVIEDYTDDLKEMIRP